MICRVTVFRPCIDLHEGKVKQIVGSSLRDDGGAPRTHFETEASASTFARRYREDALPGGHVIRLGAGNDAAAREALEAWPGGLQIGGGIGLDDAADWLDSGASHVIVTSWLFDGNALDMQRVRALSRRIGRERLVVDLSCRRVAGGWRVATDRWQTVTEVTVDARTLEDLSAFCAEFLIHAADVEGKCEGIDEALVELLGAACPLPCTYAGGARDISDLDRVEALSAGRVDLTFGSALDLFGGDLVRYADCVAWNRRANGR